MGSLTILVLKTRREVENEAGEVLQAGASPNVYENWKSAVFFKGLFALTTTPSRGRGAAVRKLS